MRRTIDPAHTPEDEEIRNGRETTPQEERTRTSRSLGESPEEPGYRFGEQVFDPPGTGEEQE